jgi:hypothetical protein
VRVNVDEKALSDPRLRRVARLMGWHVDMAIGAVVRLWMLAMNRADEDNPEALVSEGEAEDATDHRGLIAAMLESGLAERRMNGSLSLLYFAGMSERAEWLAAKKRAASLGGKARSDGAERINGRFAPATSPATDQPRHQPSAGESPATQPAIIQPRTSPPDPALALDLKTHAQSALRLSVPEQAKRFDFEALYARYPRKRGKTPGLKLCHKHIRSEADYALLGRAVDAYARECAGKDPEYMLYFSTFMGRWRDYVQPESPTVSTPGPARAQLYKPPVVASPVAPDAVRDMAKDLLAKMRGGGQ